MAEPRTTKTTETDAAPPVPAPVAYAPSAYAAPVQRNSGLVTAAIAVGSVIVAAGLFAGGVALGISLPHGTGLTQSGQFAPQGGDRNGFPTGPNGLGGPGPVWPDQEEHN